MIRKNKNQVEWLEFELLADLPEIKHAVFLRHGGCSQSPFQSLNVCVSKGDEPENVKRNIEKIREVIGTPLIHAKQCHGRNVAWVPERQTKTEEGFDGLITGHKNLGLFIKHADCQAAIFYDPRKKLIANVHCGWRGNVHNIYKETIDRLQKEGGSNPADILVCISPSLGPEASQFINFETELPSSFLPFQFKPCYFDLWQISRAQLLEAGILPEHIEIAELCTYSNSDDFFSYRRDRRFTGHHATVVALNSKL